MIGAVINWLLAMVNLAWMLFVLREHLTIGNAWSISAILICSALAIFCAYMGGQTKGMRMRQ